jgi:hypothetical protein
MPYAVLVAWLALVAVVVGSGGCSAPAPAHSSGPGDGGSGTDVSFSNDLMPLLQNSCSTSQAFTCHGSPMVEMTTLNGLPNQPRPYLGQYQNIGSLTPAADAALVYAGLVNVASNEAPSIVYVAPGNLQASFMWLKIKNELTNITAKCTSGLVTPPCGLPMPNDNLPLTSDQVATIQNWIQGGAPQN